DHDQVDQHPDAQTAEGHDHEDAGADLADVEAVDAEAAQEQAQQQGDDPGLLAGRRTCIATHEKGPFEEFGGVRRDEIWKFTVSGGTLTTHATSRNSSNMRRTSRISHISHTHRPRFPLDP